MNWFTLLVPLLTTLFEKCQENNNAERAAVMKSHPNIARARLRKTLRKDGHKGKKLRKKLDLAMKEMAAADVEDIQEFLDELQGN
jgi:ribosomal 50S subunit-associated protein YjgA (DUF615 family)